MILHVAVRFNRKIGLNAEDDVHACGILRIELYAVNAADSGSSGVSYCRAGLKAARKCKVGVKRGCAPTKGAAHGKHRAKEHGDGNEHEYTNQGLVAFRLHHLSLFLPAEPARCGRSAVSICK